MSYNSDDWVLHNLQRQRKLLEDKQRQRRLQTNGIYSVGQQQPSLDSTSNALKYEMLKSSTSTNSFSNNTNYNNGSYGSESNADFPTRNSLYSFVDYSKEASSDLRARSSSATRRSDNSGYINVTEAPKIISVQGITPPLSRKQSDSKTNSRPVSNSSSSHFNPQKPIVNIDRMVSIPNSEMISSETEDESNYTPLITLVLDIFLNSNSRGDGSGTSYMGVNDAFTSAEQTHCNPWDDDDSIPTDVLSDMTIKENPIGLIDIVNNLNQFVMEPTRKNVTMKCKITRDKKGVDRLFPTYYLHLDKGDNRRTPKKKRNCELFDHNGSDKLKSQCEQLHCQSQVWIMNFIVINFGRSNAVGTEFTIYDNGQNPKKHSAIGEAIRQELGAVIYDLNLFGLKGPRKMTIIIPGIYVDEKHSFLRPMTERDSILERYKNHRLDEMVVLHNKQPVWNEG